MRVLIVVTDDSGKTFEGEVRLSPRPATTDLKRRRKASEKPPKTASPEALDYTLPARAFIRKYAGKMTGPKKFTLLLAWLAKGTTESPVEFQRIRRDWNRMTQPMGGQFNNAYSTRAVDNGWVETQKKGTYRLRAGWNQIFSG